MTRRKIELKPRFFFRRPGPSRPSDRGLVHGALGQPQLVAAAERAARARQELPHPRAQGRGGQLANGKDLANRLQQDRLHGE